MADRDKHIRLPPPFHRLRLSRFQASLCLTIFILVLVLVTNSNPSTISSLSQPSHSLAAPAESDLHPQISHLFAKYDPVINKELARERHNFRCQVNRPTNETIEEFNFPWTLTRYVMNYNVYLFLKDYLPTKPGVLNVLDFGGTLILKQFPDKFNITKTSYPAVDIHRTDFPSESFDIVAADQVFEHIIFPHLAMLEIHRLLVPGGIAIITSCAYNPHHEAGGFHDNWRFMVDGMKMLSMPFAGGIKICGSWGTVRAISIRAEKGMSGGDWSTFRKIRDEEIQKNDNGNPFQTWVVAQK